MITNNMNLQDIKKGKWQYLASREISILFGSLVTQSFQETFPRTGIKGIEAALATDVINCGFDLVFKSYRKVSALKESTDFFVKTFKNNPERIDDIYKLAVQATNEANTNISKLSKLSPHLSKNNLKDFYGLFRESFVSFFPLQVFPFSLEQVLNGAGEADLVEQYKDTLVEWRGDVHETEIKLEDFLGIFLKQSKEILDIDFKYWSDKEVMDYFNNSITLTHTIIESRKKYSVIVFNTDLTPPYLVIDGIEAEKIYTAMDEMTKIKVAGTEFKGKPIYPGHIKAKAFVIEKKKDFENIPNEAVLIARVIEMDDIRWIKFKNIAAAITEEGGLTTHIAIVGRELKIPTIVGVKGIVEIVKTGDLVDVDSNDGIVRILK